MFSQPLVCWTDQGLYCPAGRFYIDPHRAVDMAVITHAHSDHARRGCKNYICESSGINLLKTRIGSKIQVQGFPYGVQFQLGEVQVSFHSAGHILGSAQVRIQRGSEVWVVSGDYKRESDPSCEPFEVVPCDTFITEATFGTPKYVWEKNPRHGEEIYQWWTNNAAFGKNSLLFGYSLGKAQRILAELAHYSIRPVIIHDSMVELTECYRREGRRLAPTRGMNTVDLSEILKGELILAPPSILKTEWQERLGDYETAFASGWMQGTDQKPQAARPWDSGYDRGFVISDHADWNGLNQTIQETGARRVYVLHRGQGALVRHLKKQGIEAYPVSELTLEKYQLLEPQNLTLF